MLFPMDTTSETRLRVRYAETDRMGVVYYSNYLVWMEVGRVDLCTALGFNYRDMENEDGIALAVTEAHCRYRYPARFDDEVIVKTWVEDVNPRIIVFGYEMRLAEGDRVLATGHSRHVCVNTEMQRTRLPRKYYPLFGL
jgi:acyl-CoA thioester hydrolase